MYILILSYLIVHVYMHIDILLLKMFCLLLMV